MLAAAPISCQAATPASVNPDLQRSVSELHAWLAARSYNPGPIDGVIGAQTRAAIRADQKDREQTVDGQSSHALVASLSG